MTTTAMGFDATVRGTAATAAGATGAAAPAVTAAGATGTSGLAAKLQTFEGFLKRVGHLAGVVLSDVVRFVVPVVEVVSYADPSAAAAMRAFTTSLQLVQATVIAAQQRWVAEGSAANEQKLADVLTVVELPIIQLFAQIGIHVDTSYVINLVNGVVAILNAQPAGTLGTS